MVFSAIFARACSYIPTISLPFSFRWAQIEEEQLVERLGPGTIFSYVISGVYDEGQYVKRWLASPLLSLSLDMHFFFFFSFSSEAWRGCWIF